MIVNKSRSYGNLVINQGQFQPDRRVQEVFISRSRLICAIVPIPLVPQGKKHFLGKNNFSILNGQVMYRQRGAARNLPGNGDCPVTVVHQTDLHSIGNGSVAGKAHPGNFAGTVLLANSEFRIGKLFHVSVVKLNCCREDANNPARMHDNLSLPTSRKVSH